MLEWTTAGEGKRLGIIVHHSDAKREWAYDRNSAIGRLDRGLDEAHKRGWLLVDIARDWQVIYPKKLVLHSRIRQHFTVPRMLVSEFHPTGFR
jgi:hypothetical protein